MNAIMNKKHGLQSETNFEFKYIPQFDTTTKMGEYEKTGIKMNGVERSSFLSLLVAAVAIGAVSYYGMKVSYTTAHTLVDGLKNYSLR